MTWTPDNILDVDPAAFGIPEDYVDEFGNTSDVLAKAARDYVTVGGKRMAAEPKRHTIDPLDPEIHFTNESQLGDQHLGTGGLSFETLHRMARVPFISAILGTRISQIASFCTPQETERKVGFMIRMRDREKTPTKNQRKRIQELTDMVSVCGLDGVHDTDDEFMTFERFTKMVFRDSLVYDQCPWENIYTRGKQLVGWTPIDATTIRRARITKKERKAGRRMADAEYAYAQVVSDRVVATFQRDELVFGIRRPRTWIRSNNYGYPELEELMRVVTNLIDAEVYNANNFRHGSHASGVLAVVSQMEPKTWRNFRRDFYAMLSGAYNAQKTALVQLDPNAKEDIKAINFSKTNREMEYGQWISWLLRIACAIYLMDPAELGYMYGNEGQTSTLGQNGPTEKIIASRERGLRPLLTDYSVWLNRGTIQRIDPDYELVFTGFDAQNDRDRLDDLIKRGKCFLSLNEIRSLEDREEMKVDYDDPTTWPLDATFHQTANQLRQEKQAAEQQEEGEDEEGFGGFGGEEEGQGEDFGGEGEDDQEGDGPPGFSDMLAGGAEEPEEGEEGVEKALTSPRIKSVSVVVE